MARMKKVKFMADEIEQERMVACRKCGDLVKWTPAPTQTTGEDALGPYLRVPEWAGQGARLTPPDGAGKTWLVVRRKAGCGPTFWPAELNCERCQRKGAEAAAAWNRFMGRGV